MAESSNRKELERRLEQARRIADLALDLLTKERLQRLVHGRRNPGIARR